MWNRLHEWWVRWWWLDVAVTAAATVACAWGVRPGTGIDLMGQLDLSNRRNVYTDMLSLATIFAGLGGVIFAIFIGLQSRSIREIRKRAADGLLRVWVCALVAPWASAFLIIFAKVIDRGGRGSPNEARWIAVGATALVALQLVRILWVFYQLSAIEIQGEQPTIHTSATPAKVRPPGKSARKPTST